MQTWPRARAQQRPPSSVLESSRTPLLRLEPISRSGSRISLGASASARASHQGGETAAQEQSRCGLRNFADEDEVALDQQGREAARPVGVDRADRDAAEGQLVAID